MRPIYERYRQVKRLLGAGRPKRRQRSAIGSRRTWYVACATAFSVQRAIGTRSAHRRLSARLRDHRCQREALSARMWSSPEISREHYHYHCTVYANQLLISFISWFLFLVVCLDEWLLRFAALSVFIRRRRSWRLGAKSAEWGQRAQGDIALRAARVANRVRLLLLALEPIPSSCRALAGLCRQWCARATTSSWRAATSTRTSRSSSPAAAAWEVPCCSNKLLPVGHTTRSLRAPLVPACRPPRPLLRSPNLRPFSPATRSVQMLSLCMTFIQWALREAFRE